MNGNDDQELMVSFVQSLFDEGMGDVLLTIFYNLNEPFQDNLNNVVLISLSQGDDLSSQEMRDQFITTLLTSAEESFVELGIFDFHQIPLDKVAKLLSATGSIPDDDVNMVLSVLQSDESNEEKLADLVANYYHDCEMEDFLPAITEVHDRALMAIEQYVEERIRYNEASVELVDQVAVLRLKAFVQLHPEVKAFDHVDLDMPGGLSVDKYLSSWWDEVVLTGKVEEAKVYVLACLMAHLSQEDILKRVEHDLCEVWADNYDRGQRLVQHVRELLNTLEI